MTTATTPVVESRDLQAGEHRLRVHTAGDPSNPAVLFVHGSGPGVSAPSNWAHLLPVLGGEFYCIAPDVLGFGESDHPDPGLAGGMPEYTELRARSMVALLDSLEVGKAHFVGNSMGGMISLRVAQLAPERIDRLILMGSGGAPIPPTDDLMKLITFYQDPSVAAMADLLPRFVYDDALFAGELEQIAADRYAKASRPEVRRSHLATFNPEVAPVSFSEDELAEIPHETLVIHGRDDRMIPVRAGYYVAEHLPNAELRVLPRAGHWIQIERADRFASLARDFLTS